MKQKKVMVPEVKIESKIEQSLTWWQYLIPASVLASLTALFYYPSLNYAFQFDDIANITKHFDIRHNTLKALFFSGTRWISYWLNAIHYSIGAFDPFSYRVGNVLIHTANGILIFFILCTALRNLKKRNFFNQHAFLISLLTSMLFLLHPVQTQTVSYVIQGQLEGLSTFFILCMIWFFMQRYTVSGGGRTMLTLLLFTAAMFACGTKEIAIIAPAMLMLADWFLISQGNWQEFKQHLWLHIAVAFFMIGIYFYFLKPSFFTEILGLQKVVKNNIGNVITQDPRGIITPWSFLISQFKVILHYLWIFIWPFNISVEYDWMLSKSLFSLDSFFPLLVLIAMAWGVALLLRRETNNLIAFAALWFFVCILPRSSIIPSPELLVDYKTYMASIGWLFLLASAIVLGINYCAQRIAALNKLLTSHHSGPITLAIVLAMPLGVSTIQRNTVWSSGIDFWGNMIKNAPGKARAYNNYGVEVSQQLHKFADAIPYFKKAIAMDKNYPDPWNNLAVAYANTQQLDLAIEALKEGIKLNPYYPEGYNNLASFYIQKNDLDTAEQLLGTALKLRPYYGKAFFNLGRIHLARNNQEKACESFKNSCTKADFDVDHGYAAWGQVAMNLKKYDEAIVAFEQALRLNPHYQNVAFNLGNVYFFTQQYDKAIAMFKRVEPNNPHIQQALFNIGETYFTMKDFARALPYFENLAKNQRPMAQAFVRAAQCLSQVSRVNDAKLLLAELEQRQDQDPMFAQMKQAGREFLAQLNKFSGSPTILTNNNRSKIAGQNIS